MSIKNVHALEKQLNKIIVGKPEQIRLSLVCLLAKGHLLLEDLPGSGKTTLAKSMAALLGLQSSRIQFTADMMPSDITGAMIYQPATQKFVLQKGAIFTNILLADEINRASPKCQSALLEAMEERQVSIEGRTLNLDESFFVIATQNPTEQYGTYPLPESQLDRFLFRLSMGYMDENAEISVLLGQNRNSLLKSLKPILHSDTLIALQKSTTNVIVSPAIAKYIYDLLDTTRKSANFVHGLSARAGMMMVRAAQAYAFINNQTAVHPEHVQAIFVPIAIHRLTPKGRSSGNGIDSQEKTLLDLLANVAIKR